MISEIRIHPSHEKSCEDPSLANQRTLPLICPHCQQPIRLDPGLCGNRQIDAILLQAERIGTELECRRCGLRFVFHRMRSATPAPQAMRESDLRTLPLRQTERVKEKGSRKK